MKRHTPRQYDDDDGRTICDMNVPGMPWYERDRRRAAREERRAQRAQALPHAGDGSSIPLRERTRGALSAALAGLVVFGVIGGALVLFMLFCTKVWLA